MPILMVPRITHRPSLLIRLDRYAGIPFCFALTFLAGLAGGRRRRDSTPARSILFIKLAEQGSTVLACAALQDAVRRVGRENVYFLVFEENRFIVDVLGLLPRENILAVRTGGAAGLVASAWGHLRSIRRRRIDACIDLEFFSRSSAILARLSGARIRVGFRTFFHEGPYRGNLFTHRVLYNSHLHASEIFQCLVAALDADPATLPTFDYRPADRVEPPRFKPTAEQVAAVRAQVNESGGADRRLILLNANCSDLLPLRRWADGNYIALAQALLASRPDIAVVFTGAAEEAVRVDDLAGRVGSPRCFSLAGRTSLTDLLVLYGLAEVLVTNDSGPAHFAALTPIDAVTLFGPETPRLFAARGPRSHPIWAGLACSPFVSALNLRQSPCRDNICMQRISIDQVRATVENVLARRAGR
jgi:ADP-heptose:LPS heptosyltransferase